MKCMKRWLGIMLSVMLAAGSLQLPVYAAETGETATEAAVEETIEIADKLEAEESEVILAEEEPAEEPSGETDSADEAAKEEAVEEEAVEEEAVEEEVIEEEAAEHGATEDIGTPEAAKDQTEDDVELPINNADSEIFDEAAAEAVKDKEQAIDEGETIGSIWLSDITPVETSGYYYYDEQIRNIERSEYSCAVEFDASYNTSAKFDLFGLYDSFTGTVCTGVNTGSGVFTMSIYGDGELLRVISSVSHDNNNYTLFKVDVSGVKELEIRSENSGSWANGWVYIADGLLVKYQNENGIPDLEWQEHIFRVITHTASFGQAEEECEAIGGHLATIMSAEENNAIAQYLRTFYMGGSYMIGLYDAAGSEGQWDTWVTGEPVTYSNWGSGQPDWTGRTICAINTEANTSYGWDVGEWDNGWDGDYHYICEWDDPDDLTQEIIEIYTAEDLKKISNNLSGHYRLMEDINLSALGEDWVPIGNDDPFTGTFDGNGHSITNIRIDNDGYYQGLFGITDGATIKKLSVSGVINGGTFVGGIVGLCQNSVLAYCINNATVSGAEQIGGVVGRLAEGSINYCMNTATVTASMRGCGGIVGDIYPSGSVANCLNLGDVFGGNDLTGGIAGGSTNGSIAACVNAGNVTCQRGRAGAVAGDNAAYAGERENNYFLQTEGMNAGYGVVGNGSGTFASITDGRITGLKEKILSGCGVSMDVVDISGAKVMMMYDFENEDHKKCIAYTAGEITPVYDVCVGMDDKSLEENKDYTLTYKDNKDIGTAQCTVKGIGEFFGELTVEFLIVPAKVNNLRGNNDLSTDTLAYTNYKRGLDLTWDSDSDKSIAFEIQYSKKSDFSDAQMTAAIPGSRSFSELGAPLERKSEYYVRIRAYKELSGGQYINGEWSDTIKVKAGNQILVDEFWGFKNGTAIFKYSDFEKMWAPERAAQIYRTRILKKGNDKSILEGYIGPYPTYWEESNGICYGMVNLALSLANDYSDRIFFGDDDINQIKNKNDIKNATNNGMGLSDALKYVHLMQYTYQNTIGVGTEDLGVIYEYIESVQKGENVPLVLGIGPIELGHNIVPIGICEEEETSEHSAIYVYDPNWPNDSNRLLYLNKDLSGAYVDWNYMFEDGVMWSGSIGYTMSLSLYSYSNVQRNLREIQDGTFVDNQQSRDHLYMMLFFEMQNGDDQERNAIWDTIVNLMESEKCHEIFSQEGSGDNNQSNIHEFWVESSETISLEKVPGNTLIVIASDNHSVTINTSSAADIEISISNNETGSVSVHPYDDGTCTFEYSYQESEDSVAVKTRAECAIKKDGNVIISKFNNNDIRAIGVTSLDYHSESGQRNEDAVIVSSDLHDVKKGNLDPTKEYKVTEMSEEAYILSKEKDSDDFKVVEAKESEMAINFSERAVVAVLNQTFTGKEQKPIPTVEMNGKKLVCNTDYTVSYKNNINPGTASVTITGIGNYDGTITKTFLILPGKTTRGDMFNLANNVKVTWKEVPGATYYKVYREGVTDPKESRKDPVIVTERLIGWDKDPGLTNGHAYRYKIVASLTGKGDSSGDSSLSYSKLMYRLKTVVIRSVKNTAPGKVTVKYDKTTSGDSYVLQYCERQDMVGAKTKVVLGANSTSYVIGGLKKGKTYYISIRVRKKVNGIDYYTTFGVPKKVIITK